MSDEQHRVAHFQGQPEGLALFFRPTALSFAYVAWLHITYSALPGKKIEPAVPIKLVLTGPGTGTSLWQFQVIRALLNLIYLGILIRLVAEKHQIKPKNVSALCWRALFHVGALCFFFAGAPFLDLATMAAGLYTFPLFVVLLSCLVTQERVGFWRLLAVIIGFCGSVLILRPTSDVFQLGMLLPICAGFCYGCFVVITRQYCREENPMVMVLFSNAMIVAIGLIGWVTVIVVPFDDTLRLAYPFVLSTELNLTFSVLSLIIVCAILNTTANLFVGKAYQSAESSFLAPVDYSYLVFALFWGWFFWRDIPNSTTLLGIGLIACAGLLVTCRERQVLG